MSKAREPVSSETSSGEEKTHDSSSEEIDSEPEQIRKSSAPPAAARKPQTPSAIMPAPSAKGKDKATAASASASASRSTRKRAVQEDNGTEATGKKKSKNSKKAEPEAEKKQLFQRIWSEADEIAILNGMLQFRAEKKSDPRDNFDEFFELIKKNLHFDATRAQLKDKIFRLKKKYTNHKHKGNEGYHVLLTGGMEKVLRIYDFNRRDAHLPRKLKGLVLLWDVRTGTIVRMRETKSAVTSAEVATRVIMVQSIAIVSHEVANHMPRDLKTGPLADWSN
ncbi:DNA-binding storekeeper protein-related transcriptional regulator [Striga hermonthica]|uniref:DNA-binding storekeeper protein-related transcriptional regulator n=1 Tax=Striga hermonthica TaxID=68872 RepID=A0A9N7NN62_STRHE|nr:DNA-binding storekeeper protein-related transcriptional regulator [Striga hermonthica]